ncbi:MAG: MATE family efflux transporter [Phycisphaerales bacterium]|nr:MATE family efflux transporter [Phycisphaerales bacterium]
MTNLSDNSLELDLRWRRKEEVRGVVRMAVPMVITLCSRMLMDIADFAMISALPEGSESAQAAILPAQITLWTFIVTGLATVSINNTFVSQAIGRGRPRNAAAYTWQAFYMAALYGTFALVLYPLLPHVFAWIGHLPEVQAKEWAYARICLFTVFPTVAAEAFAGFFNGMHRPKVTMWSAIEANLLNVVLSAIFVFGWLGFPAMGIAGAALGTLIGVFYRMIRLAVTFASGYYATTYASREMWRLDGKKLFAMLRTGLPQGLQATSDVCVWAVFINVLTGRIFGETSLVASNVVWQYLRISFMPTFGIGIALTALVGKAIGQRDHELAIRVSRIAVGIIVAYLATLSLVYFFFRHQLIGVFNDNPEVVSIGASVMICAVVWQVFDGVGIGYYNALKGAGDTLWPAVLLIVSHWLIVVGGGYAMARMFPEWGIIGPWSAAAALIIFLGFAMWWRWRSNKWQRIDLFRHDADETPAELPDEAEFAQV